MSVSLDMMTIAADTVSSQDWGLLYGEGLFETWRVVPGVDSLAARHVDRLIASAHALGWTGMPTREDLLSRIAAHCRHRAEVAVRMTVTRGNPEQETAPAVTFMARAIPYTDADARDGLAVTLAPWRREAESPVWRHKTLNQLEHRLAWRHAMQQGARESLFFNTRGDLAEGTRSNVFVVRGAVVSTPALECGVLPGVTRGLVCELLREAGVDVREAHLTEDALLSCDECFLTNSLMPVLPVTRIAGAPVGSGVPGDMVRLAASLYAKAVAA
jgi:branched-subunit amino acid aminotransferase/4-amino-4-deoxychorismate lyase